MPKEQLGVLSEVDETIVKATMEANARRQAEQAAIEEARYQAARKNCHPDDLAQLDAIQAGINKIDPKAVANEIVYKILKSETKTGGTMTSEVGASHRNPTCQEMGYGA